MGAGSMMGVGYGIQAIGVYNSARAAGKQKEEMRQLAQTPGLSIGDTTAESLSNNDTYRLRLQDQAYKDNTFYQDEMNRINELAHPGWTAMQAKLMQNNMDMANGVIPMDVQNNLFRSSAGRALEGGYAGSGMGRNLTARDFGMTSMDFQNRALHNTGALYAMNPHVSPVSMDQYRINTQQLAQIRGAERTQKINMMAQAAGMPGFMGTQGAGEMQVGGQMAGAGTGGGGMGGGGGGKMMGGFGGGGGGGWGSSLGKSGQSDWVPEGNSSGWQGMGGYN